VELDNSVALVTGASRNIGRATALALAGAGADVVVTALTRQAEADAVAEEIRGLGRRSLALLVDTTDSNAVEKMAARVIDELGGVDIVVLNAAIRPEASILEMSYEQWRRVIDINLDSAFFCTRAFLPGMLERHWGRIITLGGARALQMGAPNRAHVGAGKGGLMGFTRCLAVELGPTGVTVNMVSPGSIATARDVPMRSGISHGPTGRQGLPEEIAAACVYLASPGAAYVTGHVLNVNGGVVMG
jgi:3-oxoacyl-[acyl-carrier protein] reductase